MTAKPVHEEPEVVIAKWGVMQDPAGYRLVGVHAATGIARVTSPLVVFDVHGTTAETASGRVYRFRGPADDMAAARIVRAHMKKWGLTVFDVALAEPSEVVLAYAPKPSGKWS